MALGYHLGLEREWDQEKMWHMFTAFKVEQSEPGVLGAEKDRSGYVQSFAPFNITSSRCFKNDWPQRWPQQRVGWNPEGVLWEAFAFERWSHWADSVDAGLPRLTRVPCLPS